MTSSVDLCLQSEPTRSSAAKPSAPDLRQGWLKALEAAGLGDALRDTRPFPGAEGHPMRFDGESGDAGADVSTRIGAPRDTDAQTPRLATGHEGETAVERSAGESSPSASRLKMPGDAPEAGLAPVSERLAPIESRTAEVAAPGALTAQARKSWAQRNVLLLPGEGEGVEVWVRDAKLSGARMQMLLADLRRTATELGSGSVKLYLNGRPVSSTDGSHPNQGEQSWQST